MNRKLLLTGLIALMIFACKRQKPEEYDYYEPFNKDSVKIQEADSITAMESAREVSEKESAITQDEKIKGVDLSDNFFLVIASYSVEDFALAEKKELIKKGYKPEIFMVDGDGWFKLAIESYKNFDDAKAALNRVKNDGNFASVRIVSRKSKQ